MARSAPQDTEEARTLLQERLAQFGRFGMLTGLAFLALAVLIAIALPLEGRGASIVAQCCTSTLGAATWLVMRRGAWPTSVLYAVDAVATFAICSVFIVMSWGLPLYARPDMIALVCVTDILGLRAFLVPSTTRRTIGVGALVALVLLVSTWFLYRGPKVHPDAPGPEGYVVVLGVMSLGTVILTALTSKTIFGLRERVREAARLGQYTLLEKIGEGGMGIVYRAQHAMLRRPTAIKLLPVERAGERNLARFEREVQLTSALTHPNTISVYDYGRTSDGILYYAMEYVDGIDLEGLVEVDGKQEPGRVVHLLKQVAGALEEAHTVGLIHRDVKPGNVLVTSRGGGTDIVKVVDFGLVKELERSHKPGETGTNQILGTPLYMPPESVTAPASVDARSDLYALGAVGYFLLTGRPPFTGETAMEVYGHHLHTSPVPPHERLGKFTPTRLDSLILRCLEKSPGGRPESAAELSRLLDACDDIPAWTQDQTRRWWRAHAAALAQRRAERARGVSSLGSDRTVAVSWGGRPKAAPAG